MRPGFKAEVRIGWSLGCIMSDIPHKNMRMCERERETGWGMEATSASIVPAPAPDPFQSCCSWVPPEKSAAAAAMDRHT